MSLSAAHIQSCQNALAGEPVHHVAECCHAAGVLGIDFGQLLQWLMTYGLPLLMQVLALFGGGKAKGLTVQQITDFINAALAAMKAGKPVPPMPTPGVHVP